MKRLTLLRHAKSSWDTGEGDYERPLNKRGRNDASLMGHVCREKLTKPDLIVVSAAKRTRQTIDLMSEAWGLDNRERKDTQALYLAGLSDWVNVIAAISGRGDHILACAHQPGVGLFARWLDHSFDRDVPTGTVISLLFEEEFGSGKGQVDFYGIPREYR